MSTGVKRNKVTPKRLKAATGKVSPAVSVQSSFAEIVTLIEQARHRAYQSVNTELVGLYWRIGQYISRKLDAA